ncbi:hypothetical protein VB796_08755 [Arcicella sp. LKC2W]|uniref:hypothetical protein n=1 Tax=Arcicella sp. LKC2W TaxID=2984198 RepID=UPI002B1F2BE9|nr:hypothetical protein [Arcicella sp. LKC2W]MEA5459124.1 hypothetical protein [Arcicella sp. LKC2W]
MKKLLSLLMLLPTLIFGQISPTVKNPDGSIVLSGKGTLGGLNDNVQLRRYKFPSQGNFELSGYFRSISNKNSAVGFLFRNEGTPSNKSLATAGVILQRDSMKCVIRYKNNTTMDFVASTPGITLPCRIKIEKNGDSFKYYYSKQPESANSINWILVLKVENVFKDWTGLNHNILNPVGATNATAVLAGLSYKTVTLDPVDVDTRPSCNNGGNFTIASVTNTSGTLYNVDFNAANLSNTQVVLKNSSNAIVKDFTQSITARPQLIDLGLLSTDTYKLQFVGKSCFGTSNSYSFNVVSNTSPTNEQLVIVMAGESNAGSRVPSADASAGDLGLRAGVTILNNNTLQLEAINIPSNSNLGENAAISGGWGWEVGIANLRASGALAKDVVIVKTAQGGAFVGQYNTNIANGYWSILQTRINAVKTALQAQGKTPKFKVIYSQGINNAVFPTLRDSLNYPNLTGINYWQAATSAHFNNLRTLLGTDTQISVMKFWGSYGTYLNSAIDNIVNSNPLNSSFTTSDLAIQGDGLHVAASGTKEIPRRALDAMGLLNVSVPIDNGGGSGGPVTIPVVSSFTNPIKSVPFETTKGKYNPNLFSKIGTVYSTDAILGKTYPNWAIAWQAEGSNFAVHNMKTFDLGISFMYDQINGFYGGYGQRCTDYIYFNHPATSDENCLKPNTTQPYQFTEFVSAIPFEKRGWATYGETNVQTWQNYSLQQLYNEGINATGAVQYGWGDRVNNKSNTGLSNADIENGFELAQDGSNKHLAFLQGMGASSQGYVFSQYSAPLNVAYLDPANYPLNSSSPSSAYPALKLNPDGSLRGAGNDVNNVPYSSDWNFSNTLSLTNKSLNDYKNVLPCAEVSSLADAAFHQGETFDASGSGEIRTVNKFYPSPNADHIVANTIHAGEVIKWFVKNKLDNRKVVLQSKITCDRLQLGITSQDPNNLTTNTYGYSLANEGLKMKHFDREYGFDIGAFTAMTGCEWQIWDRNTDEYLDGYHGAFGIINLLYQRKNFSNGVTKSFVDLKPTANFLLWDSEISYDNGATYVKQQAQEYLKNRRNIPQRQFITSDGYWGGFLARPENTEDKTCKLRVTYNGQTYTYTVTADMWETTDYNYRNTALSALPDDKKDYHYFLVKLSGTGGAAQ